MKKNMNMARAIRRALTSEIVSAGKTTHSPKQAVAGYVGGSGAYGGAANGMIGAFLGNLRPETQVRSLTNSVLKGGE